MRVGEAAALAAFWFMNRGSSLGKQKSLTNQGDFDKIIDTDRRELCFLSV